MPSKKPLTVSQVQKQNIKFLNEWISKNKSKIKPKAGNKAIFYSGNSIDSMIKAIKEEFLGRGSSGADEDLRKDGEIVTGIYKQIEKAQKNLKESKAPVEYEMLHQVLSRIRSHPKFIDQDSVEKFFASAAEYLDELKKFPKLFPKPVVEKTWTQLSGIYAQNVEGDVETITGVADDFRNIGGDKIFVKEELARLIKNKKLSKASKEKLSKIIGLYMAKFDNETKKEIKAILKERDKLKKGGVN